MPIHYENTEKKSTTINRQQIVEGLKNILMSNDLSRQQENALIIAMAELLKE